VDHVPSTIVRPATLAVSLSCSDPAALAQLNLGERVLDPGSGGGIDVLLSARRVGPTGFAYGVDMTDEMLTLAEKNKPESAIENVTFLKGHIEDISLSDETVDVVLSNSVIDLATDKSQVLREAVRMPKPGGRFAVSDVGAQGELPADLRSDPEAWVGCVAVTLEEQDYRRLLTEAGFGEIEIVYDPRELDDSLHGSNGSSCCGGSSPNWDASAHSRFDSGGGRIISALVLATKALSKGHR
jgi:arsenite methyltransferase